MSIFVGQFYECHLLLYYVYTKKKQLTTYMNHIQDVIKS